MSVVTGPDNQREEKISSLVRLYEKDLLRTCCVYLRDRDMAQDAVQETFLKAYNLVRQGHFKTVRIGSAIRISRKSFDEWLESQNM